MPTINTGKKKGTTQPTQKQNWSKYYNTKAWKSLRNYYIQLHPLCEECLAKGIVRSAEEVHHKIPFGRGKTELERYTLLTAESNLQSLCRKCHEAKHKKEKSVSKKNLENF